MARRREGGGGGSGDVYGCRRVQAVLLADSFTLTFRPLTLEYPKARADPQQPLRVGDGRLACARHTGPHAARERTDDRVLARIARRQWRSGGSVTGCSAMEWRGA